MRKISKVVLVITCIVFAVFQSTILEIFKIGRIKPDILLMLVLFIGLSEGAVQGLFTGLLCGFLNDVLSGGIFGINIFTFGLLGFFIGAYRNRLYRESLLIQVVLAFVFALLTQLFHHFVLNLFVKTRGIGYYMVNLILPYSIYTAAVSPVVFFILDKLSPSPKYRQL